MREKWDAVYYTDQYIFDCWARGKYVRGIALGAPRSKANDVAAEALRKLLERPLRDAKRKKTAKAE